jgi:hypothetical protein
MNRELMIIGAIITLGALAGACTPPSVVVIRPSGNIITKEFDITGFDQVDVSHAFIVDIAQGESFGVVLRVDDNVLDHLEVVKQGSTLKIGLETGTSLGFSTPGVTLEATVSLPELVGVELSGASHGKLSGFESSKSLDVNVSGASHLSGDITCGDAWFEVSGASQVRLSGSGSNVRINASGASIVDLADLPAADARVQVSGASKATVNASGRLDAEASGASTVFYLGEPTLGSVETSGASSIKRQ